MARLTTALLTAGLVLVTACGGDDGDTESGADEGDESTEASGEPDEEAAAFCDDVQALGEAIMSDLGGAGEAASEEQQQAVVENMRSIEPPAEIADDWDLMLDGMEERLASGGDSAQDDPDLQEAVTNLGAYSQQHCSPTTGTTEATDE